MPRKYCLKHWILFNFKLKNGINYLFYYLNIKCKCSAINYTLCNEY